MTYQEKKEKAKELGVEFTGQPSTADLDKWIAEAEGNAPEVDPLEAEEKAAEEARKAEEAAIAAKEATYEKPTEESKNAVKKQVADASKKVSARQAAMKMTKVKITPLDERMRSIPSEYYSVGNKHIGFISKVVKFNQPTWEPECILQLLREKTMLIQESATVNGKEVVRHKSTEAFAIVELPLTNEEKEQLEASKK